jgi:hypothetical protein
MGQRTFCPAVCLLAAVILVVMGCSSGTVTPSPTVAATPVVSPITPVSPSQIVLETPTPTLTATSTIAEKTPFPTDWVTGKSFLADLQAGGSALDKYKVGITAAQIQKDYDALMASSAGSNNTAKNLSKGVPFCLDGSDPKRQQTYCAAVTNMTFVILAQTGAPEAEALASDLSHWDMKVFPTAATLGVLTQTLASDAYDF